MGNSKYQSIFYSSVVALSLITAPIATPLQAAAENTDGENQQTIYTAAQATAYITLLTHTSPTYVSEVKIASDIFEGLDAVEKAKVTAANVAKLSNHKAAVTLVEQITGLPTVVNIQAATTVEDFAPLKELISTVRTAYNLLTSTQKSYVSSFSTLTAAEAAVKTKQAQLDNEALLTDWNKAVSELPAYIGLKNVTVEEFMLENASKYNSDHKVAITAARAQYAKLAATPKTYVKAEDLSKLTNLETDVKLQTTLETNVVTKKAADFTSQVDEIELTPATFAADVEELVEAYNVLDTAVLAKVANATKTKLSNYQKAAIVVEVINNAGDLNTIEAATSLDVLDALAEAVTTARTNYTALLSAQKTFVKNLTTLTNLESAITKKRTALNNVDALTGWTTAYDALPEVKDLVDLTVENFEEIGYQQEDINAIAKARAEYQKLTATLKGAVSTPALAKLVELEAGVKQQAEIKIEFDEQQAAQEALEKEVLEWTGLVTALGDVIEFTDLEAFKVEGTEKYTSEHIKSIEAARTAYGTLSDDAKTNDDVKSALTTLEGHEAAVAQQEQLELELKQSLEAELLEKITAFVDAVTAVETTDATTYTESLAEATVAYEEFGEDEVGSIPAASKTAYDNHLLAEVVTTAISEAGNVDAITDIDVNSDTATSDLDALELPVKTARTAYTELATATLKQLVGVVNYADLTALETAIQTKKDAIALAKEVKSFIDAIAELPADVAEFTDLTFKNTVNEATKYDIATQGEIEAARNIYKELSPAATADTAVTDALITLESHEEALIVQTGLIVEVTEYLAVKDKVDAFLAAYANLTEDPDKVTLLDLTAITIDNYLPEEIPADANVPDSEATPATPIYTPEQIEVINGANSEFVALKTALTVDGAVQTGLVTKFIEDNDTKKIEATLGNYVDSLADQIQLIKDYNAAQVQAVILAITALNPPELDTDAVNEVKENFEKLGDKKSEVSAFLQTKLSGLIAASAVVESMEAITKNRITAAVLENPTDGEEVISTLEEELIAAENAYKVLALQEKGYISNATTTFADLKEDIAVKRFALEAQVELADWQVAYVDISTFVANTYDKNTFVAETAAEFSDDDKALITAAREAYDNIDEKFINAVDDIEYSLLEGLEENIDELADLKAEQASELTAALSEWTAVFSEIDAIELKTFNAATDAYYTEEQAQQIKAARTAYTNLEKLDAGTLVKPDILTAIILTSKVSSEDLKVLTDLEQSITTYEELVDAATAEAKGNVDAFIAEHLDNIGTAFETYASEVNAVATALGSLTATEQNVFKTSADYAISYTTYTNNVAAASAVTAIQAAGTVAAIEAMTTQIALNVVKPKVTAADTKFTTLTEAQQGIVTALTDVVKVSDLKAAVEAKQAELDKKAAIATWIVAYGKLPAELNFNGKNPEDVPTMIKYSQVEKDLILAARSIYNGYTEIVKGYVLPAELEYLEVLEAAVAAQKELEDDFADSQVQAAIDAEIATWNAITLPQLIGYTEDMTKEQFEGKTPYTEANETAISQSRVLYDVLSDTAKEKATDSALSALEVDLKLQKDLKSKFDEAAATTAELKAYNDFISALTTLNISAETYVTDVTDMKDLYDALSSANLAKVSNANKTNVTNHVAAAEIVEEINTVADLDAIDNLTTDSAVFNVLINIEVARSNYSALNATQRSFVKNYAKLATAETAAKAKRTALQNEAAIATWKTAYDKLPNVINLTSVTYQNVANQAWYNTTELAAITGLRAIFNGYSSTVQGYVPAAEVEVLKSYEAVVAEYKRLQDLAAGAAEATTALGAWKTAFDALPTTVIIVEGLTAENYSTWDKYTVQQQEAIAKATEELGKLSEDVKAYIATADLQKHKDHVAAAKELEDKRVMAENATADAAVPAIIDEINALVKTDVVYVANTIAVGMKYDALSVVAKAKISTAVTAKLVNHRAAVAVIEKIATLSTIETINAATTVEQLSGYKDETTTAREAYTKLTSAQKGFVTNLATLTAIETAITTKLTALENAEILKDWNLAVAAIPVLPVALTSTMTVEVYKTATKYQGPDLQKITAARAEYTALTATAKRAVSSIDLKKLTDAEAQVKIQVTLDAKVATAEATTFTTLVNAISLTDTVNFNTTVTAMYTEYGDLSAAVKAKLANATKTKIENLNKAAVIVDTINKLDSTTSTYKTDVAAARVAYTALLSAQKTFVKNLATLVDHEAAVKLLP